VAQADLAHLLAQRDRSSFASATTVLDFLTQENACIQERAGSNHQRPAPDRPRTGSQPDDAPTFHAKSERLSNYKFDTALLDQLRHRRSVEFPVRLEPRPLHCRSLASVEHATVNRRTIRRSRHQAIEDIQLSNKVPLPDTSN
jgi:hypothetical protein